MPEPNTFVFDFTDDPAAYLNAVEAGQTIRITESTFHYFLDVLPPVYMGRTVLIDGIPRTISFGFAEGPEPITAFWTETQDDQIHYFCKQTTELNRS